MQTEQYELLLSHVNALTERRQTVTTTYLSVNTAIVGATAFLFKDGLLSTWQQQLSVLVLFGAGLIACNLWYQLISQYSTLLSWWYGKLRAIETQLPVDERIFTDEYDDLYAMKRGRITIGLTRYEKRLTWLFTMIYLAFGCAILISLAIK